MRHRWLKGKQKNSMWTNTPKKAGLTNRPDWCVYEGRSYAPFWVIDSDPVCSSKYLISRDMIVSTIQR